MRVQAPFKPPFCPNPDCQHHREPTSFRWTPHGWYYRQAVPKRIARFRCLTCGRTFSSQTFSTTYFLKKPRLLRPIFHGLVGCSGLRQIARSLGVAHSTVQRQAERLGRHCLLFSWQRRPTGPPAEPLVLDGFQTFELSQFWPCDFNLLVGSNSHYLYAFTDSELRRSGRMTAWQKARRKVLEARHGRPHPKATELGVTELLRLVVPESTSTTLISDEHQAYPRALRRLRSHRFRHVQISSKKARTAGNPLFPVNLADLLIRHGGSNQKRETIAFSKRRQAIAERMAVFQVWRNFMKRFSENHRLSSSPAMRLGLSKGLLTLRDLLKERLFPSLVALPGRLRGYYERLVPTRQLKRCRGHALKLAC